MTPLEAKAWEGMGIEIPNDAYGRDLIRVIARRQLTFGFTGGSCIPTQYIRLFVHELGGKCSSEHIGRQILPASKISDYDISPQLNYDVRASGTPR